LKIAILAFRRRYKKGKMVLFLFARTAKRSNVYRCILANHNTILALSKTMSLFWKSF